MKTSTKYILASIALLALIIACTKEVGLYTEVEFDITEEHETDGFISTPLATFLTITPEELLEDLSYSFSYKINSGAGYFEAVDGTIIQEGEKTSFSPLSASLDYIPTVIGDHSVTFTASDTFGFTEEITLSYTITNIPVTWIAEGPTGPVLLGSSQSITVTLGNEAAVTGATYQRNYSFSEGSGNLYTAAPESNTIAVNDFVSIEPGTYQLEYISNELGVTTIEFLLRDSNEQELIATVTFEVVDELSSEKEITSFIVNGVAGTITETAIDLVLPEGTDLTALAPVIIHTGASISPESETNQDFSSPVIYTVTAQDETIQAYTVNCTIEGNDSKDITDFVINGVNGTIIGTNISLTLPAATDVTALEPTVTHTGATVSPVSGVAQDFTNPVIYTVTAIDASTQEYTVMVTVAPSDLKDITIFAIDGVNGTITGTDITVILPSTTDVTALEPTVTHTGDTASPVSGVAQDFTNPVEYTVTAADGTTQVYTVTVSLAPALSSDKDITSFTIDGETENNSATAFTITLPAGTDVTALSPSITHTGASINPASGVAQDFINPVEYTVTAADGTTQVYTVTVSLAPALSSDKDITSFTIDGETVNNPATAFTITLPAGTDVTALSPSITQTGASISPASGVTQNFTTPVEYTVTAADGSTQMYSVTVTAPALSSTKAITALTIGTVNGTITGTNISLNLPAGTDVTALSPSITHSGVSINPATGAVQDFTSPVSYTVTAADGTTQMYTVTVTAPALSSTKAITAFTIGTVNGTITGTNISLTLPAGTDVTALSPSITHSGVSINPASGVVQNFTSPVEYTVTAADGTTQVYTVTVSLAAPLSSTKDITSFSIDGETVNDPATAFTITLPAGTDVTTLSPSITQTGASISPATGVTQNFTTPVEYTVTAADGSTQVYTVTVTAPALSSTKAITAFKIGTVNGTITGTNISLTLPAGTDVSALSPSITHTGVSINPATGAVQDFSSPVSYTVTAADGTTQVYSVTVAAPALSSAKAITAFTIGGVNGTISGTNISVTLPAGTNVTALSTSITHTGTSISPASGAAQDFSSPVSYTVTAADGTTQVYSVTVTAPALSSNKDITLFIIGTVNGTITGTNISLTLPAGTDVTALSPSITHTGASINPANSAAQDFTSPVSYTVTAADGTTQVYSVTVTAPALSSDKDITLFIINGEVVNNPSSAFTITLPAGTDVTTLSPTIVHEGNAISPASGVPQDFSSPVSYTVTAADGTTQVYSVTVTAPALSSTKAITAFTIGGVNGTITGTNISLTLPAGTDVTALSPSITHTGASINPASGVALDFSSPLSYTVTAADGTTQVYSVTVTAPALSSAKAITAFTIGTVNGTITGTNISLILRAGTNVTALSPSITHTGASINPASGAAQDFSSPVSYSVTAADGSTQVYSVTVTIPAPSATFSNGSFIDDSSDSSINPLSGTLTIANGSLAFDVIAYSFGDEQTIENISIVNFYIYDSNDNSIVFQQQAISQGTAPVTETTDLIPEGIYNYRINVETGGNVGGAQVREN
ncbi:DUF5018 domain-containing protein [Cellulophaga baltica]|uniref:beta strand repeat-containing protein n=1 Tax=Cellulophaga baltica TaxID=76594 RepID=UPI0021498510|nr:DUF5018 domain-containing protein [Cellulophaga baltica]MCR1024375.1 DUF5018 domain-containing protein [Cellulophaga baltica]